MEPERKIEKLLRAYAKKRRVDAGDRLKLHPATRRLLQGEVARRKPKPDNDEEASVTLWELFRQRWALFAGFAIIIFFGAALFLPALNSAKKKSESVATLTKTGEVFGLINNGTSQLVAVNDSVSRQLAEAPAMSKDAEGNAVAASRVAGQTKSEAERSDEKLSDSGAVTVTAGGALVANAPAAAPLTADRLTKAPGAVGGDFKTAPGSVHFATATQNFDSGVQNSYKNTIAPPKAAPVLANFQVQQNGSAIRVVDADGSVYDGALQPENVVAQKEQFSPVAVPPPANAPAEVDRQKAAPTRDEPQMAQNYFFRVTGTNLTLKQSVVFNGNLLANFNPTANGQQVNNRNGNFGGGGVGGLLQSTLTNQLPWSNLIITGTAVVSDTNNIEINAVPQSP